MSMKHDYASESELCKTFVPYAKSMGWRVFPETSNHDLLLVATAAVKTINAVPGDQIGVQAKLKDNIEVLCQAMPKEWDAVGPHYHAVLVPVASEGFRKIARRLGLLIFQGTKAGPYAKSPPRRSVDKELFYLPITRKHYYSKADWHPEVELWTPPGVPSPSSVTPWKVSAVRLCIEAERKGYLTSDDFRKRSVSMGRWVRFGWVVDSGEKIGRGKKYILGTNPHDPPPHKRWPEIAAQLILDEDAATPLTAQALRKAGVNTNNG